MKQYLFTLILLGCLTSLTGQPGSPDPTFGDQGVVRTNLSNFSHVSKVVALPDGKLLACGDLKQDNLDVRRALLVRYLEDGSLDPDFGEGGIVYDPESELVGEVQAINVFNDGRMLLAANRDDRIVLMRLLPDGQVDSTFNQTGQMDLLITGQRNTVRDIAIREDGAILLAGAVLMENTSSYSFLLAQLRPDGSLDTAFANGGFIVTPHSDDRDELWRIIVSPDGRILVAGRSGFSQVGAAESEIMLFRYRSDGSTDLSFGNTGRIRLVDSNRKLRLSDIAITPEGRIVVGGSLNFDRRGDWLITMLLDDGGLDTEFGDGGFLRIDLGGNTYDRLEDIEVQVDGSLLLLGLDWDGQLAYLIRTRSNGEMDETFGDRGVVTSDAVGWYFRMRMALQADGKIVVGGSYFTLLRYESGLNPFQSITTRDRPHFYCPGEELRGELFVSPGFDPAGVKLEVIDSPLGVEIAWDDERPQPRSWVGYTVSNLPIGVVSQVVVQASDDLGNQARDTLTFWDQTIPSELQFPPAGATNLPTDSIRFAWSDPTPSSYILELSTDSADFAANRIYGQGGIIDPFLVLPQRLDTFRVYYWRLVTDNECGQLVNGIQSFRTGLPLNYTIRASEDTLRSCIGGIYRLALSLGTGLGNRPLDLRVINLPEGGRVDFAQNSAERGEVVQVELRGRISRLEFPLIFEAQASSGRPVRDTVWIIQDQNTRSFDLFEPQNGANLVDLEPRLDWDQDLAVRYLVEIARTADDFEEDLVFRDTSSVGEEGYLLPAGVLELQRTYYWRVRTLGGCEFSNTFAFNTGVTGTKAVEAPKVTLYPNPSAGEVYLRLPASTEPWTLRLLDLSGVERRRWRIPAGDRHFSFDPELPPGLYFVEWRQAGAWGRQKLHYGLTP